MKSREELFSQIGGVTFYDVLSFTLRGARYDIQLEIFYKHPEKTYITWYKDNEELHHNSFNMFISSIDKGIIDSVNPDNIISWSIFNKKMDLDKLLNFNLESHISYMLGYGISRGRLGEENEEHFKEIVLYSYKQEDNDEI